MLGLTYLSTPQNLPISRPTSTSHQNQSLTSPSLLLKTQSQISKTLSSRFTPFAQNGNNNLTKEELKGTEREKEEQQRKSNGSTDGGDSEGDLKRDGRPLFNFRWGNLLDPDPDNIVAVGLTGLLTWASVQVLWQLLFISFAILVAAVKYSFIAAFLIFILITLL